METLTIEFSRDEDMAAFVKCYRGTWASYHPNYDGEIVTDRILGSWTPLVHLQRSNIKDFRKLGEDIKLFHGKIRF